ncbi:MAG: DNA-binding NtrC family response regulator [Bradymonadia bacterium]|jgi:DNA-binding NtrC family response regulator
MAKVLVVDDNPAVCTALQMLFEIHGMECIVAQSPRAALGLMGRAAVGVVVQDMNFTRDTTGGEEGMQLFEDIRALDPDVPVLLMTAWTSVETAVRMVQAGASDYIQKPWDDARVVERVESLLALGTRSRGRTPSAFIQAHDLGGLIVESPAMQAVVNLALRVAAAEVPVLVTGPNGAGKEGIAEIVQANSRRAKRPFIKVNAGALPEQLLESELFGAEAGAYTGATKRRVGRFEAAHGGTLFLDEIGNLSPGGQMKLLRVLQTGEFERVGSSQTQKVDVRIISATNSDLPAAIAAGTFREDLYFRLNVIELAVPSLAERPQDVLPLARHFVDALADAPAPTLTRAAEAALLGHTWPGNVRELKNCMQRACLLANGRVIEPGDIGLKGMRPALSRPAASPTIARDESPEAQRIRQALEQADGVVAKAASTLGLSRQALYRRMQRLGIVMQRRAESRS